MRAGASPRGLQTLVTARAGLGLLDGRYNASIDDIRAMALPALRHRILLNFEAQADGIRPEAIVAELLAAR